MTPNCERHSGELAIATCSRCKLSYCDDCIFYVTDAREPMCVPCAMAAAGVRRAREPKVSRKHRKMLAHQARVAEQLRAEALAAAAAMPEPMEPARPAVPEPAWAQLDLQRWDIRPA